MRVADEMKPVWQLKNHGLGGKAAIGPEKEAKDITKLVKACSACHGNDGQSLASLYPHIGGQNKLYLLNTLRAYQNGTRTEPRD